MADLRAQLEITADAKGVEVGVSQAKKSLNSLGIEAQKATKAQSASIDKYVRNLGIAATSTGKSAREAELYRLALRGATEQQLKAADAALRLSEKYEKSAAMAQSVRTGLATAATVLATATIAAAVAFDRLIKSAGDFQDMGEKIGDTAQNVASLALAAGTAGVSMESVVGASTKLTKGLTGVDDESKAAGAALAALGLNIQNFKALKPADQIEAVAKAFAGFEDGAEKTAVAMALFGKSGADLLPFLKELGSEGGRQNILTSEQIRLADEYSDRQAKLRTEISLHAQAIATDLLPALNDFAQTIADLAKDQEFAATASDVLKGALAGAVVIFQTIAIVASDVGFVFKGVGREIGAIAAQMVALSRLDLQGFNAISKAVKEDAERARAELDRFQARIMAIGNTAPKFVDPRLVGTVPSIAEQTIANNGTARPRLRFSGPVPGGGGSGASKASSAAKAQLSADLDQIKSAATQLANTYSNAEKIMEATRASGLLSEREYYESKRAFIGLNAQAQEDALNKELARLKAEKTAGEGKIEQDKKIADAQAKLLKVREDASASLVVLGIQETAANKKIADSYTESRNAAQSYIDTVNQQYARELSGFGLGNKQREFDSGTQQINDKYEGQRQTLAGELRRGEIEQPDYDQQLALINEFNAKALQSYTAYYAKLGELQGSASLGFAEAMRNYQDEASNIFAQVEQVGTKAMQGIEDALVTFVTTGKLSFTDLANSIVADIARIIIKQQISNALGVAGGGGAGDMLGSFIGSVLGVPGRAIGGPVSAGGLYQVNERGPELLNVAGKQYLMMGSQGGSVEPSASTGATTNHMNFNFTVPPSVDRRTQEQIAAMAGSAVTRAARRLS